MSTRHEYGPTRTRNLPVFIAGQSDHGSRPGVVRGHYLYSDAPRIHVSGGGDGLVEPVCTGLGVEQHAGSRVLCASVAAGAGTGKSAATD